MRVALIQNTKFNSDKLLARSATSSRPSTVWPSGRCTTSTTRACRPTPRSSTR
jgi:hypothetical protein